MPSTDTTTQPATTRARRGRRLALRSLLAIGALMLLASCTPDQMRQWYADNGIDASGYSEEKVAQDAHNATLFWAEQADLGKFNHVLSEEQLFRLRWCESTDNYQAVSSTGLYRGAYQFHRGTWDNVARQHYPKYVGQDPAQAHPTVQNAMARALWSMTGPRSWPVCGYRV